MSSSPIIPKGQLTAYQRWEMAAFDEEVAEAEAAAATDVAPQPEPELAGAPLGPEEVPRQEAEADVSANLPYPTAEEMEAIHQQAYQDAFGEGQKAGYEQGFEQGLSEGRQSAAAEVQRLAAVVERLDQCRAEFEASMSEVILDLALSLTRQMLRQTLEVRRELLVPLVREALSSLPQIGQHPRILVNPDDGRLLREAMVADIAHLGLRIIDDATISPGGCRIEAGASDIDATVESRWGRLMAALAQDRSWLDASSP